ncbi:MAG: sialidase family protein [Planctomycetota bacterium]
MQSIRPPLYRLAFVGVLMAIGSCARAEIAKSLVFKRGTDGYNIYRIPTMEKAANGELLAFAEARSGNDASEIDIVVKRSDDNGATWGPLEVVVENDNYRGWDGLPTDDVTAGNQSPVVDLLDADKPGRIWMPFTLENDRVFVTYSDDHGQAWPADASGRAREITPDIKQSGWAWYATGPVHGIQLTRGQQAGRLLIPSDHTFNGGGGGGDWGAQAVYSDDHGQSWQLGAVYQQTSDAIRPDENVAVELVDSRVSFNSRDTGASAGGRSIAYSSDGGLSDDGPFAADTNPTPEPGAGRGLGLAGHRSGDWGLTKRLDPWRRRWRPGHTRPRLGTGNTRRF